MRDLSIAPEAEDARARVLCARCYSLSHYGRALVTRKPSHACFMTALRAGLAARPRVCASWLANLSRCMGGATAYSFSIVACDVGQVAGCCVSPGSDIGLQHDVKAPHTFLARRQIKSARAEAALPEFDLGRRVGRKIGLQRARRAVVLCVVDAADFDGSLPRAALQGLFSAIEGYQARYCMHACMPPCGCICPC